MSLTVTTEKVVVLRVVVTSDPQSYWPPLCQIMWKLCCNSMGSPEDLKQPNVRCQRALGVVQMLIGLLSMILISFFPSIYSTTALSWLCIAFFASGMLTVLMKKSTCRCLACACVGVNVVAAVLALMGFGLFASVASGMLPIILTILCVLQAGVSVVIAVRTMETMQHKRDKENDDDEPLLKEDLSCSEEKGLHHIAVPTKVSQEIVCV